MRWNIAIIFYSCAACMASCDTDALTLPHGDMPEVTVAFDWSGAPGASPEGMRVVFYPHNGQEQVLRYDLAGTAGGDVGIAPGGYSVVAFNNDTESVSVENGDDYGSTYITTVETSVTAPLEFSRAVTPSRDTFRPVDDEPVRRPPERVWAGVADTAYIYDGGGHQTVTMQPAPVCCDYDFSIRHIKGIERVKSACAAITGMTDGIELRSGNKRMPRCTLSLKAVKTVSGDITGSFITFGHNEADTTRHFMELYVITDDGGKYRFHGARGTQWDVTGQIDGAPDARHVSIVIDGVDIPQKGEDPGQGEAFEPGTDPWHDVHVTVPL